MEFTGDIRRLLARGRGARPLDADDATRFWGAMLDGAIDDAETGAVVAALAVTGETAAELVGLHRAAQQRIARWSPAAASGVITIPAYGLFAGEAAVVSLAAMLLRRFDLRVVVHGVLDAPRGVSSARVLRELGVMPSPSLPRAGEDLAASGIAFVPIPLLSPPFARLLALRSRLGIETTAHRVAQALDPAQGLATRIVLNAEGVCGPGMEGLVRSLGGDVLALTWMGDALPAMLALRPRIERFHAGVRELLFEADAQAAGATLPAVEDAGGIAAAILAITTGRTPVPAPALNLVAACLYAARRAPDLARAKAAAAVAGHRLAA